MKKTKKKSILSYFWKYKKSIITYISIFVIIAAIGFFASIETAKFLDGLAVGENEKALYSLIAITLVGVFSQVFYFLADIMYVKVSNKISIDIKKDLAHRVLSINSAMEEKASVALEVFLKSSVPPITNTFLIEAYSLPTIFKDTF